MTIDIDREKYFRTLKERGLSAALSDLHGEMEEIEQECFNTPDGYRSEIWEDLKKFRDFSRELWEFDRETSQ